ncbi:piggyBac transposable element-derived protein 4-like [Anabrus simplex]|uniref:piggyBac transposable element-derived protein 4-like n=1 Tax=Anabrus simplex TaxID=316456 RepID=UPI0035A29E9F
MPPPNSALISYFNLFFISFLLNLMVSDTNCYAHQFLNKNKDKLSPQLRKWKDVTLIEMRGFLACILNMGINRKATIASYWSTFSSQSTPWFANMFSFHRFQHIFRFFHLVDSEKCAPPGELTYDPRIRFQPLPDHANNIFRHHYTPYEELSIDESLVGTKNRTCLMQYLPIKHHHRWGIKFWMLCDSVSNYSLGFFTYRGARSPEDKDNIAKCGLGYTVVMRLLKLGNYLQKGYHVFVDNFLMSVPLVKDLFKLGTYITGTVRRNRKYLPKTCKRKFGIGETLYCRSGPVLACAYREKKSQRGPVILLSSKATANSREVEIKRGNTVKLVKKQEVIHSYNKFMGGIDTSDMMLYAYLDERRTVRYWKKVAFNIIARMVLNSYILYKEHARGQGKLKSRLRFIVEIIEHLGGEWLQTKNASANDPRGPPGVRKLPDRRESRCCVCTSEGRKQRSRTICTRCSKGLHGDCYSKHKC